jgi:hypothetical protein
MIRRARRRKNPANLLLLLHWPITLALWYAQVLLVWCLVVGPLPDNIFQELDRRRNGFPVLLLTLPPFFSSIGPSMLAINFFLHLVPPLRRIFDREAEGHKGCSYAEAQHNLLSFSLKLPLPCLLLSLAGAWFLR